MNAVSRFTRERHYLPEGFQCTKCGGYFISGAVCPHCQYNSDHKKENDTMAELHVLALPAIAAIEESTPNT